MSQELEYTRIELIESAQTLTAGFVSLGSEVNSRNYRIATLFLDIDINDSEDVTVQPLSSGESSDFSFPLKTSGTGKILVDALTYEINTDADQKIAISMDVSGIREMSFQVKAGTLGSSAGIINTAVVMFT